MYILFVLKVTLFTYFYIENKLRTCWRNDVSQLTWEHLDVLPEVLREKSGHLCIDVKGCKCNLESGGTLKETEKNKTKRKVRKCSLHFLKF